MTHLLSEDFATRFATPGGVGSNTFATADLDGALLDAAVARVLLAPGGAAAFRDEHLPADWAPSERWEHAGPVIASKKIDIGYSDSDGGFWYAAAQDTRGIWAGQKGPTPLIAAMRALVAAYLGYAVML